MKRVRFFNILGMVCNVAIMVLFTLSCYKLMQYMQDPAAKATYNYFARYDVLASMLSVFSAVLMIIANIVSIKRGKTSVPRLFSLIAFFAATFSAIAFILNICMPSFNGFDSYKDLFSTEIGTLYFAFIIPIITIAQYLFISIDKKLRFPAIFFPFGGTILYVGGVMTATLVTKTNITNYRFFRITQSLVDQFGKTGEKLSENIIMLIIFIAIAFALSLIIWMVNRIDHIIIFGVSIKDFEQPKEVKKEVATTRRAKVGNYLKNAIKFNNDDENNDVVYHISYHNRKLKTWKVKTEDAGRALKVFKTQKEAIDYAKFLVATKGGSIRIHSMVGKIRKDW